MYCQQKSSLNLVPVRSFSTGGRNALSRARYHALTYLVSGWWTSTQGWRGSKGAGSGCQKISQNVPDQGASAAIAQQGERRGHGQDPTIADRGRRPLRNGPSAAAPAGHSQPTAAYDLAAPRMQPCAGSLIVMPMDQLNTVGDDRPKP